MSSDSTQKQIDDQLKPCVTIQMSFKVLFYAQWVKEWLSESHHDLLASVEATENCG